MAREGLSFEQVEEAAKKITGRGERVSLRSVRAELGSGSLTTIQRHLNDMQGSTKRQTANKVDAALELPEKVVQALLAEIEAVKQAVREEMQQELDEARADRDALATEVERLTIERDQLNEERLAEKIIAQQMRERWAEEEKARKAAEKDTQGLREDAAYMGAVNMSQKAAINELKEALAAAQERIIEAAQTKATATPSKATKTAAEPAKKPTSGKAKDTTTTQAPEQSQPAGK